MQLPIIASPEDVMQFAKYLSTKVSGSTLEDAKAAIDKKLVDPRKINAYIAWGMVVRDSEKLKLSDKGKRLVKAQNDEEIKAIYQEVIQEIEAYNGVLEWLSYKDKKLTVTNVEVAAYWHETSKYNMANENDNTLKDRAVCFFKVCEAAGFGKLCIGRRGQPTRLELYMEAIFMFLQNADGIQAVDKEVFKNTEDKKIENSVIGQKSVEQVMELDMVSLPIPFIDGRCAVLNMPKNADKEDAQYVFDMLHLILSRQYELDNS